MRNEGGNALDNYLKHHGVKGMKWGVVRWRKPGGKSGQTRNRGPNRMRMTWDSKKRERQWGKIKGQINNMSTSQIREVTKRITLENEMKRLSKSKLATKKDKEDYLRRSKMSDDELARKVVNLRVRDDLNTAINNASKEQRELGQKIVRVGGAALMSYATGGTVSARQAYNSTNVDKSIEKTLTDIILNTADKKAKDRKVTKGGDKSLNDYVNELTKKETRQRDDKEFKEWRSKLSKEERKEWDKVLNRR